MDKQKGTIIFRNTISRQGKKPTFEYVYAKTRRKISESLRLRIEKTYIPNTWDEVEIYTGDPKLIATGMLKGKTRYLYKKDFTNKQSNEKYRRMYRCGLKIDEIKKDISNQLKSSKNSRNKVIATALWFLIGCYIRVGNEKYLKENNSYGLLTLHKKHIKLSSGKVNLDFIGKKQVRNTYTIPIPNAHLSKWLSQLHSKARPYFFQYNGHRITASDLNSYIQEHYGSFTAKDFRTWGANMVFISELRKVKPSVFLSKRECQSNLKKCIENVSIKLNNTVAVCKSNYICKSIIDEYQTNGDELLRKIHRTKSNEKLFLSLLKTLT
jgi:DNA topoisomerase-1